MTEPTTQLKVGKSDVFKVPSSMLQVKEGANIRTDYGDMTSLIASIRENGVRVPMRGSKVKGEDLYHVTDGHRRLQACQALLAEGIEILVPFISEPTGYTDEQRLVDMFLTAEGKSLTPLEQSVGVERFVNYGYSTKEIAKKLGKSEAYIDRLRALSSAPKKFLNLISEGVLSGTYAMKIVADKGVDAFLDKYDAGEFSEEAEKDNSLFSGQQPSEPKQPAKKITQSKVEGINSLKAFKKVTRNMDADKMNEGQAILFKFAWELINNELTEEQIAKFFS